LSGWITDRDITTRVIAEAANPKMTSVRGCLLSGPHQHFANIYAKLGVHTRAAAAAFVRKRQLHSRKR
jgi:hypothetical protein